MRLILLLLSYNITYNYIIHQHRVTVQSYALNPRALHPNGKVPSIAKARSNLSTIHRDIFDNDAKTKHTIILVDGNNIRNSFGHDNVSALQLTEKMSIWIEDTAAYENCNSIGTGDSDRYVDTVVVDTPQIVCIWDGGTKCTSQIVASKSTHQNQLAVYSGPNGNADDLIVKCCAFLSSLSTKKIQQQHSDMLTNVFVFTSDSNLANRCQMQLQMGQNKYAAMQSSGIIQYHIYHSIYLCLLLDKSDYTDSGSGIDLNVYGHRGYAPSINDWERTERRTSVDELQTHLDRMSSSAQHDEISREEDDEKCIGAIHRWINNGLHGVQIGRVTKGGSILYECK